MTKVSFGSKTYDASSDEGFGMGPMMGERGMDRRGPDMNDRRGNRGEMGQGRGRAMDQGGQCDGAPREMPKSTTIEGKLAIVDKSPVIQTKDKTYTLRWADFFYYVYADGIKEGVQIKAEGFAMPAGTNKDNDSCFMATKITIGAKTYDIGQADGPGMGPGMGFGPMGAGMMGGRW